MSEWSKEPDLRPGASQRVGSNPTSRRPPNIRVIVYFFSYSVVVITQDFDHISIYEGYPETSVRIRIGEIYCIYCYLYISIDMLNRIIHYSLTVRMRPFQG